MRNSISTRPTHWRVELIALGIRHGERKTYKHVMFINRIPIAQDHTRPNLSIYRDDARALLGDKMKQVVSTSWRVTPTTIDVLFISQRYEETVIL